MCKFVSSFLTALSLFGSRKQSYMLKWRSWWIWSLEKTRELGVRNHIGKWGCGQIRARSEESRVVLLGYCEAMVTLIWTCKVFLHFSPVSGWDYIIKGWDSSGKFDRNTMGEVNCRHGVQAEYRKMWLTIGNNI